MTVTTGTLYIISAPSGAGKTSLVKALVIHFPTSQCGYARVTILHSCVSISNFLILTTQLTQYFTKALASPLIRRCCALP